MILTADTVVWKEGRFYGKPVNREEAYRFLSEFSGGWQTVVTGMTLVKEGEFFQEHGLTKVLFNTLSHEQKNYILDAGAWEDKAGGYGAQGSTSLLVKSYEGCFYNVLGLPVNVYSSLLSRIGINLWQYV
jgi:septum formation protein